MFFVPKCKARFGLEYGGDHEYGRQLEDLFGGFVWDERVVAEIRPVAREEAA
jgi:hypothetical protein